MSDFHNVDIGVATDMLKSNLEFNKTIYEGGGVISSEDWKEMSKDYWALKDIAIRLSK